METMSTEASPSEICSLSRLRGRVGAGALAASEFVETTPTRLRCAKAPSPAGGRGKNHTDAVVTPPSTTMVCPVMKLEASEPR
jgi:hypothetical protein